VTYVLKLTRMTGCQKSLPKREDYEVWENAALRKIDMKFRPVSRDSVVTPQLRMFIRAFVAPRNNGLQTRPFRQIFLANSLYERFLNEFLRFYGLWLKAAAMQHIKM
jgi:hypothetical protein